MLTSAEQLTLDAQLTDWMRSVLTDRLIAARESEPIPAKPKPRKRAAKPTGKAKPKPSAKKTAKAKPRSKAAKEATRLKQIASQQKRRKLERAGK